MMTAVAVLDVIIKVKEKEPLKAMCLHYRFPFYQSHNHLFDMMNFVFHLG